MCAPVGRAEERNGLSVGRPSWRTVGFLGLRDLYERSSGRIDDPNVLVTPLVEFLPRAIGNKSNLLAVRRPLRVRIVPIVARRELLRGAGRNVNDPQMQSLVVEPSRVVELIVGMFVMPNIAWGFCCVTRSTWADAHKPGAVRRPCETVHAVLKS